MLKNNENETLPMFAFFEQLRVNQFPLGIGEYHLFLNALQLGFGVNQQNGVFLKENILRLCKLLWLKPDQSTQLFEELFQKCYLFETQNNENTNKSQEDSIAESPQDSQQDGENIQKPITKEPINKTDNSPNSESSLSYSSEEQEIGNQSTLVQLSMGQNQNGRDLGIEYTKKIDLERSKFLFSPHYYPINQRKTHQNLRLFAKNRLINHSQHIDIDATINKTIERGLFTGGEFHKSKINTAKLLLLIDHQGSMIAFHFMAEFLKIQIEKVLNANASLHNKSTINSFYFYNLPQKYLYKDTSHTKAESKTNLLNRLKGQEVSVLIFSDAGAARGLYNPKRINATKGFLKELQKNTHRIAWLNPMPKNRWEDTSAQDISNNVAMFEATETGIKNAIQLLKGSISRVKI